jgi:serine/threonine-protein kinase
MATVYLGCLVAGAEMVRTVAIKRVHASLAVDAKCTAMMLDEARLASRISHPNVVPILDVIRESGEIMLVLEYVHGVTASQLAREGTSRTHLPPAIAAAIVVGALRGLHAAHCATDEHGRPMGLVHRDVSPQNIMVGIDGAVRVIDFGIARALGRAEVTTGTELRGKVAYMAPERLRGQKTDLRVDLWSAGVVLWELVSGKKLFEADDPIEVAVRVCTGTIPQTGNDAIDAVLERALARDLDQRFKTAAEMADALEQSLTIANSREVTEVLHKGCEKLLNAQSDALTSLRQRFASRKPGELVSSVARTPIAVDDDPGPDVRQEDTGPTSIRRSPVDTRDAAPLELVVPASIPRQPIAPSSGQVPAAAPLSGAVRTAAPVPAAGTPPHSGTVPRATPVASSATIATAAKIETDLTAPASDEAPVPVERSAPQQESPKLESTLATAGSSSRKGATQPLAPPMSAPTPEPPSAEASSAFAAVPASRKGSTIPLAPAQSGATLPVPAQGPAPEGEPVIELDTSRGPPARTSQTVPIGAPASSTGPVSLGPLSPHTSAGMAPTGTGGLQRGEARTSGVPWGVIGVVLGVVVLVFGLLVAVLFAMSGT